MGQFIYLKEQCSMFYPVGKYFYDNTRFIRETAKIIREVYPNDTIILVVRGHSGSILAGGIAYLLHKAGISVKISISRKEENSHGENLDCIYRSMEESERIIIVDDFVDSGDTIYKILEDLESLTGKKYYDMLCISNRWDEEILSDHSKGETYNNIISHFRYICCNEPYE